MFFSSEMIIQAPQYCDQNKLPKQLKVTFGMQPKFLNCSSVGDTSLFPTTFCTTSQLLKVKISGGPLDNQTWHKNGWLQQKLPKFGFYTDTTALWPMEQSSILFAKSDCPVAHQNFSFLATAHDCETGLLQRRVEEKLIHTMNEEIKRNLFDMHSPSCLLDAIFC